VKNILENALSAPQPARSALRLPPLLLKELAEALGETPTALAARSGDDALRTLHGGRRAIGRSAAGTLTRQALARRHGGAAPGPIAFINLKGGVGKTTLATNLAVRACQWGLRVCVVDLDPQASSTLALMGEPDDETRVFLDLWQAPADTLPGALCTIVDGLDLLPSSLDNTLLDGQLAHPAQQKRAVRGVCERLAALGYDLVLIDCPPALGTAVISTLCAIRQLVIPVCADAFSLKGLRLTLEEMTAIGETFSLPSPRVRVLFNRHDRRERLHADALTQLRAHHGAALMNSVLRVSSHYARALAAGQSVFSHPRQPVAAADLDRCLRELLDLDRTPQT
jgi:chromosome partitioning protein